MAPADGSTDGGDEGAAGGTPHGAASPHEASEGPEYGGGTPHGAPPEYGASEGPEYGGGRHQGPPPPYEEVTLADLVITIWDHRRAALGVLVAVLLVTVAFTGYQAATVEPAAAPGDDGCEEGKLLAGPYYHANAAFLVFHEEATARYVLETDAFAADAVRAAGIAGPGEDPAELARSLDGGLSISTTGSGPMLVRVTANLTDAEDAAALANGVEDAMVTWVPFLENTTWERLWPQYYERTNQDEDAAAHQLRDLIAGLTYMRSLEAASIPSDPAYELRQTCPEVQATATDPGPSWSLNLALGTTLGLMLAFMTPFVLEAAQNVRRELRAR